LELQKRYAATAAFFLTQSTITFQSKEDTVPNAIKQLQSVTGLSLAELAGITPGMSTTRLAEASNDTRPLSPAEFERVKAAITKYRLRARSAAQLVAGIVEVAV
jgi:hypothetical protein